MVCWKIVKTNKEARLKLRKVLALDALVETGESRTPNADHSVAAALRELSVCLARLADTFDWTDHTSKRNQKTDHFIE